MRERTKLGLAVLEAALLLGVLGDLLLRATPWGLNVLLWVGGLTAALAALTRGRRSVLSGEGRWLLPCVLAFAAAFAWRDSLALQMLDAALILALLSLAALRAEAVRLRVAGLTEYARAGLAAGLNALFGAFPLVFNDVRWDEIPRDGWMRHAASVLRGAAIAIPLLLIFGALFAAADAIYEGIVLDAFAIDVEVALTHVVLLIVFGWLSAGFLRGAVLSEEAREAEHGEARRMEVNGAGGAHGARAGMAASVTQDDGSADSRVGAFAPASVTDETCEAQAAHESFVGNSPQEAAADGTQSGAAVAACRARPFSLGIVEVGVVLGALNLLFFSFVAVQLRYFFGGADVVLTSAGLTYAEYARSGFFELTWVAALLLPLLLAAHHLLRKENPAHERTFRVLSGALLLFLFVIMASAVGRMRLYQAEYGQTELRLYVTAFMGWLALVFVWFALTVLRGERERFAWGALASALLVVGALHFVNPGEVIVRTNVARAADGRDFDAFYATRLGADAVPALIEALPAMRPDDRSYVASEILAWAECAETDWRSWNLSRWSARRDVAENEVWLREYANATRQQEAPPDVTVRLDVRGPLD